MRTIRNRWRHFRRALGEYSRTPRAMLECWLWNSRWDYRGRRNGKFWFGLKTRLYYRMAQRPEVKE